MTAPAHERPTGEETGTMNDERYGYTSNVNDLMNDGDPDVAINWYMTTSKEDQEAQWAAEMASEARAEMIAHGGTDGLWYDEPNR